MWSAPLGPSAPGDEEASEPFLRQPSHFNILAAERPLVITDSSEFLKPLPHTLKVCLSEV